MKASPEECKVELAAKLLEDYRYMYNYNIELVDSTSAWRKEKDGLIKDLTESRNKVRKLDEECQKHYNNFMSVLLISLGSWIGYIIVCLL